MEIPEGFYKAYEKDLVYDYQVPSHITGESYKVVLETLDSFFDELFGFHIVEPVARAVVVSKVK